MVSHQFSRWGALILIGAFVLTFTACGGDGRLPVEGEVSLDGEAVDQGAIVFVPQGGEGAIKTGGQIVDGRYVVPAEKGPSLGEHKVLIYWEKKTGGTYIDEDTGEEFDERTEGMPGIYLDQETTPLTVEFVKGQEVYDFIITSSE